MTALFLRTKKFPECKGVGVAHTEKALVSWEQQEDKSPIWSQVLGGQSPPEYPSLRAMLHAAFSLRT